MHRPADARLLRAYWRSTYAQVKVTKAGAVMARKSPGGAWGLLETPEQAADSVRILRAWQAARKPRA